jgi:hypothetical protein
MPRGEKTKQVAFQLWKDGKSLREAQATIGKISNTLAHSVSGWFLDWERGSQQLWEPTLKH